ncbi:efflux RND transporter periplasmic adaptor subunit [Aquifex pyrophilus]
MKKASFFLFLLLLSIIPLYKLLFHKDYEVYVVRKMPLVKAVYATGYVKTENEVEVKAKVSGYVVRIFKDTGDEVRKGEVLAFIENKPLEKEIERVKTEIENLKEKIRKGSPFRKSYEERIKAQEERIKILEEKLKRRKKLYERELISRESYLELERKYKAELSTLRALKSDYEESVREVRRKLRTLKKRLEELESKLFEHYVRSPVDGVILKRNVEEGDYVNTFMETKPLFIVGKKGEVKTILEVDEEYGGLVKERQKVYIYVEALKGKVFEGKVVKVYRFVDKGRKTFEVEVRADYGSDILSGTTVEANIILSEKEGIAVPEEAIEENKVKVLKEGKIFEKDVVLGERYGNLVEVLRGLEEGDKVVLR